MICLALAVCVRMKASRSSFDELAVIGAGAAIGEVTVAACAVLAVLAVAMAVVVVGVVVVDVVAVVDDECVAAPVDVGVAGATVVAPALLLLTVQT